MIERYKPKAAALEQADQPKPATGEGHYFPKSPLRLVRSGCTLLDCALAGPRPDGGGWVLGRVANIVGDKSVGKTLQAIEACANFARQYPKGRIWYREAEAAFDEPYARGLGLPTERVDFGPDGLSSFWNTIEAVFEDLDKQIQSSENARAKALAKLREKSSPKDRAKLTLDAVPPDGGLYIIDSLDAVSSKAILERGADPGYNLDKQKILSQLFSQMVARLHAEQIMLLIVSQTRQNIGVTFGDKYTRSGGKSLDFYSTHILWLSHIATLTQTHQGVKRATGVKVRAKVKKNKVTVPFRECEYPLRFGYGIDDNAANLAYLTELGRWGELGLDGKEAMGKLLANMEKMSDSEYAEMSETVRQAVIRVWAEIEHGFVPKRAKYGAPNNGV